MKKVIFVTAVDKRGKEYRNRFNTYDDMFAWLYQFNLKAKRTRTQYVYVGEIQKSKSRK